jgi:hypothetical protein
LKVETSLSFCQKLLIGIISFKIDSGTDIF